MARDGFVARKLSAGKGATSVPANPDGTTAVPSTDQEHVPDWYVEREWYTTRPEWTELHVPYRADSDLGKWYHHLITPVRALAILVLWGTHPDNLIPMLFILSSIVLVTVFLIVR